VTDTFRSAKSPLKESLLQSKGSTLNVGELYQHSP